MHYWSECLRGQAATYRKFAEQADDPVVKRNLLELTSGARSYPPVVGSLLAAEVNDSPNTKYRSRSGLLQERASKLVSGSGELTTRIEPAMIGCEA
jgi:hypothetical protein